MHVMRCGGHFIPPRMLFVSRILRSAARGMMEDRFSMRFARCSMDFDSQSMPFARESMIFLAAIMPFIPATMLFVPAGMLFILAGMQSIPAGRDIVSAGIPLIHRGIANDPDALLSISARGLCDRGGRRFEVKAMLLARDSREWRYAS
jgi:hypothetical protein